MTSVGPEPLTMREIDALVFHPEWADGRHGFVYCRFDGIIDHKLMLRGELTWEDDADEDNDGDKPLTFFSPILLLESNRLVGKPGKSEWKTVRSLEIPVTTELAKAILAEPPSKLAERYPEQLASLRPEV